MSETFAGAAAQAWHAAATLLGWRPGDFWAATPKELRDALVQPSETGGPDRPTIEALMQRFPDENEER